jgi:Kef-type K+ transport system membrane component KefB/nucleotide-binding universal stress UspA family protein
MSFITTHLPITDPTLIFFVVLCIILFAPMLFGKLRIPHLIGMILAGVFVGQHGLGILERDSSFEIFGQVGLYYIMFLAGLEIDMEGMKRWRKRGALFGLLTFGIPFATGLVTGLTMFHYTFLASLLIACILSSHTLVSYPIVSRFGLSRQPSVTIALCGTVIALFLALLILAALAALAQGESGMWVWASFLLKCLLFCGGVVFFVPRLTRWFFRKISDSVAQFIYLLVIVFLCASVSKLCGMDGLLGAFLAGLVLNRFVPHVSPLMTRVEFVGNALFIPYFLIGVGMLINIGVLFSGLDTLKVIIFLVVGGTLAKWLASASFTKLFGMNRIDRTMMFGLSEAHAAGALAMVMVGRSLFVAPGVPLMSDAMLNGVVIMILFSCIISSVSTEHAAKKLALNEKKDESSKGDDEKMLISISNPETVENLVDMSLMMMNRSLNRGLIGIHVVYDDNYSDLKRERGQKLLANAVKVAAAADVRMQTQVRISTNVANGIVHALKEYDASEIVIGLHRKHSLTDTYLGSLTTSLVSDMHRQLMIVKCLEPVNTLRRIQVAIPPQAEFETGFYRWVERLARLTEQLGCRIHFHGHPDTLRLIKRYMSEQHKSARTDYSEMPEWDDLLILTGEVNYDHLLVVVSARRGSVSYQSSFATLPDLLARYFADNSLMVIYPDQFGEVTEQITFSQPHPHEETPLYQIITRWLVRWLKKGD